MKFTEFKTGPARSVFAGLGKGWSDILEEACSFEELRQEIVFHNDSDVGRFVAAVRRYAGKCSTVNTGCFSRSAPSATSATSPTSSPAAGPGRTSPAAAIVASGRPSPRASRRRRSPGRPRVLINRRSRHEDANRRRPRDGVARSQGTHHDSARIAEAEGLLLDLRAFAAALLRPGKMLVTRRCRK